ncbi:MAG: acyloxyacyl hydrolase [Alphaproteobacteria bacterium]|nr:acyloxyacyl hydrolase [Alphaproteobacteria bacterium]
MPESAARRLVFKAWPIALALAWPAAAQVGPISEVRGGLLAHDVAILGSHEEEGVDVNAEILFRSPQVLRPLLAPRPHVGVDVNTLGDTSVAYAGLTWQTDIGPLWGALAFGGAVHDGEIDEKPGAKGLGSRALFRLAGEVGWYASPHVSISLLYDHYSNATLAEDNEGLNNLGLRFGYRF